MQQHNIIGIGFNISTQHFIQFEYLYIFIQLIDIK